VDTILNPVYFDEKPIGFFDGAVVNDNCGVGIFLKLCAQHVYKAYFAGGKGNNMKVEIMGLWGLLHLAQRLSIKKLMVVGDSKVTIDWINDCSNMNLMYLHSWKDRIKILKEKFEDIQFMHIHREFNTVADRLSKQALDNPLGSFYYEEIIQGITSSSGSFMIF
jgi:ribonuclease HI